MNLDKAIKTSQEILDGGQPTSITDRREAIGLGIEALKAVILERDTYAFERIDTLPGETEE